MKKELFAVLFALFPMLLLIAMDDDEHDNPVSP